MQMYIYAYADLLWYIWKNTLMYMQIYFVEYANQH